MSKKLGDNTTSSSTYFNNGIFIENIKIEKATDKSNYPTRPRDPINVIGDKGFAPQLCIELEYEGKKKFIFGNFEYSEDKISGKKKYLGWKRYNNAVWSLLYNVYKDEAEINDDDSIPEKLIKGLVGKEIIILRYCIGGDANTGKPLFKDFFVIKNKSEESELLGIFNNKAPSLTKYDPNYFDLYYKQVNEANASFNPNEPEKDDLPF